MNNILHKIKVFLYDNILTADNPNDLIARVSSERSLNVQEVCTSAVTRGGADVSAAAMEHSVRLWLKEMGFLLCDGFSINADGWFNANVHIKGVFGSPNENFNPAKHTILFNFHQGSQLRKEIETVTVEILGVADAGLSIVQVTDVKTSSVNDLLTPGANLKISGSKLKIAGDNPANGIYLVNNADLSRLKINALDIVVNNPSELIILLPATLSEGEYQLEITTQYSSSNGQLSQPRTAVFDRVLTVQ